jgi:hypothetical protein
MPNAANGDETIKESEYENKAAVMPYSTKTIHYPQTSANVEEYYTVHGG